MVKRLLASLADDFPEYVELHSILGMAAVTWSRFGISANELSDIKHDNPDLFNLLAVAVK